jgi:hypothetical protein
MNDMTRPIVIAGGVLFLVGLGATAGIAGQLEPPGPVMPTDRVTLNGQEIEPPHTITEPGSYVLTSDIRDCIPCDDLPTNGIIIAANDVTLDMNGFALVGAPGNSLSGIVVQNGLTNVVITNGVVRDWDGQGIDASGARNARGIAVAPGSLISHCTATGNLQDGLVATPTAVPNGSTISDSTARSNGGSGILAGDGTTIVDCNADLNGGHGISTGVGCTIRGNTVASNAGDGILTIDSLVHSNSSSFNTGANINATSSTVIDNHVGP